MYWKELSDAKVRRKIWRISCCCPFKKRPRKYKKERKKTYSTCVSTAWSTAEVSYAKKDAHEKNEKVGMYLKEGWECWMCRYRVEMLNMYWWIVVWPWIALYIYARRVLNNPPPRSLTWLSQGKWREVVTYKKLEPIEFVLKRKE